MINNTQEKSNRFVDSQKNQKEYDKMTSKERWDILAMVANLYYNHGMTQSEIANRIYTSRSKVSRMLLEARNLGIVEINIHESWKRNGACEEYFSSEFNLKDVRIIKNNSNSNDINLEYIAEVAAYYLEFIIKKDMTIGVSWGNTLYKIVQKIAKMDSRNFPITVVPIMGTSNTKYPQKEANAITKDLACAYGGNYYCLDAPLFVSDVELTNCFVEEKNLVNVLNMAKSAELMLTSVGDINDRNWHSALTNEVFEILIKQKAVGHIGGHFYDINGNLVLPKLDDRIIGVSIDDMKNCPCVMCIASGKEKAKAVIGALRSGAIDILIIDELCAKEIEKLISKVNE